MFWFWNCWRIPEKSFFHSSVVTSLCHWWDPCIIRWQILSHTDLLELCWLFAILPFFYKCVHVYKPHFWEFKSVNSLFLMFLSSSCLLWHHALFYLHQKAFMHVTRGTIKSQRKVASSKSRSLSTTSTNKEMFVHVLSLDKGTVSRNNF